ncbi:MAG: NIPSNAP family protein [Planctomycetes bacterium]|nr:NIPSNAP family protein [Planctomycetota bacterium]
MPRISTTLRTAFTSAVLLIACVGVANQLNAAEDTPMQEYYELRIYRTADAAKRKIVSDYAENALLPALSRQGIDRVGVFTRTDDDTDFALYMLIPFKTLAAFSRLNGTLAADPDYGKAARDYFAIPKGDAPYARVESKLMKAFAGMPVMEIPKYSADKQPRLFELRTYESHNADKGRLKVEMFNEGEIDIMRDVKLAPLFYGETLIGDDVPNLTYMLTAPSTEAHDEHWNGFRKHPDWQRMKALEKYKDTVSKINRWYLAPTEYSQL